MLKYDILAISVSNLAELGPIFYPLGHMFPVRLIMSGVLLSYFTVMKKSVQRTEAKMSYISGHVLIAGAQLQGTIESSLSRVCASTGP